MLYRWLAVVVVGAHFAFLAYLVLGGFMAWRWPRTVVSHMAAVGWAGIQVFGLLPCPLTALQDRLRELGGERALRGGFIDSYVKGVLYPAGHEGQVQVALALLVAISWAALLARRRRWTERAVVGPRVGGAP